MKPPEHQAGLLLVLSYRRKAQSMLTQLRIDLNAGNIGPAQFTPLERKYLVHLHSADKHVGRLRSAEAGKLKRYGRELRAVQRRQRKLVEALNRGNVQADAANERNRRITQEFTAVNDGIRAINSRLTACDAPVPDSGFVDCPLEEYAKRLGRPALPVASFARASTYVKILALILCGAAILFVPALLLLDDAGGVRFEAYSVDAASRVFEVLLRNTASVPVRVVIPWPEAPELVIADLGSGVPTYGLSVSIREAVGEPMRLLPGTESSWSHHGLPLAGQEALEIAPGLTSRVRLDINKLSELGVKVGAVRLALTNDRGRALDDVEFSVGGV